MIKGEERVGREGKQGGYSGVVLCPLFTLPSSQR